MNPVRPRQNPSFEWPPGRAPTPAPAPAPTSPRPTPEHAAEPPEPTWRAVERTWLGLQTEPVSLRIARHRWIPDDRFVYCPRCAASTGPYEADLDGCASCRHKRLPWDRAIRLGEYHGLLQDLICDLKFHRWRPAADALGRMLAPALHHTLHDADADPARTILIPVPSSYRRRLARGIDHTLALVRALARHAELPIARPLVRRHGPTQWAVPPSERWRNVARSFRCRPELVPEAETLILVDDIRTTGATLTAAGRTLAKASASGRIWVATAAVARWRA